MPRISDTGCRKRGVLIQVSSLPRAFLQHASILLYVACYVTFPFLHLKGGIHHNFHIVVLKPSTYQVSIPILLQIFTFSSTIGFFFHSFLSLRRPHYGLWLTDSVTD